MIETRRPFNRITLIILYAVMVFAMGIVLLLSLIKPANNLIPGQMGLFSVFSFVFVLVFFLIWDRLNESAYRIIDKIYYVVPVFYAVALFVTGVKTGDQTVSFFDLQVIVLSAKELLNEGMISYIKYFATYGNNVNPMFILYLLFRLCRFFHLPDFHFLLSINILIIVGASFSVGYLVGNKLRFPALLIQLLFIPIWCTTGVFYTDQFSFGIGIICVALLKYIYETKSVTKRVLVSIVCAFLTVYGTMEKITSIIPLIALALTILIFVRKWDWKKSLIYVVSTLLFFTIAVCSFNSFNVKKEIESMQNPITFWVALGMHDDGSYSSNSEFSKAVYEMESTEQKSEYIKAYMAENWDEAFRWSHISKKIIKNFANGNVGASEFTENMEGTPAYELINPWGKYYWRVSQFCFIYIILLYSVIFIRMIMNMIGVIRCNKIDISELIVHISFLGIFIFLMIWEANNRQLYNNIPVLIMGFAIGMQKISIYIKDFFAKEKGTVRYEK